MLTIRRFLALAGPFWFRASQWCEWLLLLAMIGCTLGLVRVFVLINAWNKTFYDALAAFDAPALPGLIAEFLVYIGMITFVATVGSWLRKTLLFRWRDHLTLAFENRWLDRGLHYRLQITAEPDNPDQRISEDILMLSEKSIDLFKAFIQNATKLGAFIVVLWQLSGVQTFEFNGTTWTIHGYLVWIALFWSLGCTLVTHVIGRWLQPLNVERQHREADYRATLLRIRDHAEQVALYQGEDAERQRLRHRFGRIRENWPELILREFKLEVFSTAYLRVSFFIPVVATLPMYMAKTMSFGSMMQAGTAFSSVQDGFGWFMDYYKRIMEWAAVVERLGRFEEAMQDMEGQEADLSDAEQEGAVSSRATPVPVVPLQAGSAPGAMIRAATVPGTSVPAARTAAIPGRAATTHSHGVAPDAPLDVEGLVLHTAEGRTLARGVHFTARPAEWLLVDGRSGVGKSTLLRTLAGLWPWYEGHYQVTAQRLFLPQRPYLPLGTLRETIAYPGAAVHAGAAVRAGAPSPAPGAAVHAEGASSIPEAAAHAGKPSSALLERSSSALPDDATLQRLLALTGLERLAGMPPDEEREWSRILSGGEQQRLSLCRVLYRRPPVLFLDEATNQLDDHSAEALMRMLKAELPDTLVVGISHQQPVKLLFGRRLDLGAFAPSPVVAM